jgi:hypothetical protein
MLAFVYFMKYRKQKVYSITRRLHASIRASKGSLFLRKIKGCHGFYDEATEVIFIDYRKEFIPTIIHEFLHKWHYDKSESWVLKEEHKIVNSLTTRQIQNILKVLVEIF